VTDYYPFGQEIVSRQPLNNPLKNYRFGFNGKENDSYWGTELVQDYGFGLCVRAGNRSTKVDIITKVQLKNYC
jgi:hypothetical protein